MAKTSEVNDCELLKIEKMKTYNERMVELGLQPVRYLGEQILSSQKESTKCRPTKRTKAQKSKTSPRESIVVAGNQAEKPLCFESEVLVTNTTDRDTNCCKCGMQFVYETSRFCSMCVAPKLGNKNEFVKADSEPCAITLYDRIFKKPLPNFKGKKKWGREYLRDNHTLQWKVYNQNVKMVRCWFSNQDDPDIKMLLTCNLRNSKELADKGERLHQSTGAMFKWFAIH